MSVQAIAGVSPTSEARIMTEFPSVAASGIGCLIGKLMDSIPVSICGVKLSYLVFGLPLAPLGMLLFLLNRPFGARYILTNRSVQVWSSLGTQRTAVVDLKINEFIEQIQITVNRIQERLRVNPLRI